MLKSILSRDEMHHILEEPALYELVNGAIEVGHELLDVGEYREVAVFAKTLEVLSQFLELG